MFLFPGGIFPLGYLLNEAVDCELYGVLPLVQCAIFWWLFRDNGCSWERIEKGTGLGADGALQCTAQTGIRPVTSDTERESICLAFASRHASLGMVD